MRCNSCLHKRICVIKRNYVDVEKDAGHKDIAENMSDNCMSYFAEILHSKNVRSKYQCCFIHESGKQCPKQAEYEIRENTRRDPDNYKHSCGEHIGKLLGTTVGHPECLDWTVSYIGS